MLSGSSVWLKNLTFQFPLAGSLGRLRVISSRILDRLNFNSLSRDHTLNCRTLTLLASAIISIPSRGITNLSTTARLKGTPNTNFNSLSRDHCSVCISCSMSCIKPSFQFPLAGSRYPVPRRRLPSLAVDFNSLSRDHCGSTNPVSETLSVAIISIPSRGITGVAACVRCRLRYYVLDFNSLSRDHQQDQQLEEQPTQFQFPLAGSHNRDSCRWRW